MFIEYIYIFKFFFLCLFLALAFFLLSFIFVYQTPYDEKLSIYECGFNPWGDARNKFEVRFYLVGILFIIFDLEIVFIFPWIITIAEMSLFSFLSMVIFLFILTLGFVYEWNKGALEWT